MVARALHEYSKCMLPVLTTPLNPRILQKIPKNMQDLNFSLRLLLVLLVLLNMSTLLGYFKDCECKCTSSMTLKGSFMISPTLYDTCIFENYADPPSP